MRASVLGFLLLAITTTAGCGAFDSPAPPPPFSSVLVVQSDPGVPVAGAEVSIGGKVTATTGADGRAALSIKGTEGDVVQVSVRCPEKYRTPTQPLGVRLARLSKGNVAEFSVMCPPTTRRIVVAVKAENGGNLPVRYLDQVVARTDDAGIAEIMLDVVPGTQFALTLDTNEKGNERLKPQNPSRPFVAADKDDVLTFEQKFQVEKRRVFKAAPPKPPKCLNCGRI